VITVEKEVLVERPADEVFDFLADVPTKNAGTRMFATSRAKLTDR
jgi:hypothetical protein